MYTPLVLKSMLVYVATNRRLTIQAREAGKIKFYQEIAEPILIMAESIRLADWILQHTLATDYSNTPDDCDISAMVMDNSTAAKARPLVTLVTNGIGFPQYIYN